MLLWFVLLWIYKKFITVQWVYKNVHFQCRWQENVGDFIFTDYLPSSSLIFLNDHNTTYFMESEWQVLFVWTQKTQGKGWKHKPFPYMSSTAAHRLPHSFILTFRSTFHHASFPSCPTSSLPRIITADLADLWLLPSRCLLLLREISNPSDWCCWHRLWSENGLKDMSLIFFLDN